jgi:hypothetical protein
MNAFEMEREEELIEEYIYNFYDKSDKKSEPITDGIVNIEKYIGSKYKICWVLKEPYDEDDGTGGGWSLTRDVLAKEDFSQGGSPTWQPMIYVTYSLLNNFIPYSEMDSINDDPEMSNILKHIAFININKMPAFHRSNDNDISKKYVSWRPLLHWQLKIYNPQIIIFGNTFQHFKKDLNIRDSEIKNRNYVDYVVRDKKIYAHAYHPAQTQISREDYVQGIINVVKMNVEKIL